MPGINTLLLSTGDLGSFTCSGMTLPIYIGPTALRGIRATGDTLSNVESQVFTNYAKKTAQNAPDTKQHRSVSTSCKEIADRVKHLKPGLLVEKVSLTVQATYLMEVNGSTSA